MVHYDFAGISLGMIIGLLLWCIALMILNATAKNGNIRKGLRNLLAILVLAITIVVSLGLGEYFGSSLKTGDFSDRDCTICDAPSVHKFTSGMGIPRYYCEEHFGEAQEAYDRWNNLDTKTPAGEKCESCDKRYTDDRNKRYLSRTNLCRNCYRNFCFMTGKTPSDYD